MHQHHEVATADGGDPLPRPLPNAARSGATPKEFPSSGGGETEAGEHLVENQHDPVTLDDERGDADRPSACSVLAKSGLKRVTINILLL